MTDNPQTTKYSCMKSARQWQDEYERYVCNGFHTQIMAEDFIRAIQQDALKSSTDQSEKLAECLRNAMDQLFLLSKEPQNNPWVKECNKVLSSYERSKE